jgi:hypothetical protein
MDAQTRLTWDIAEWIREQQARPLPAELDRHLRRMTFDAVVGMVASSVGPVSGSVARHAQELYQGNQVAAAYPRFRRPARTTVQLAGGGRHTIRALVRIIRGAIQ